MAAVTVAMQQLIWAMQNLTDEFHDAVYRAGDLDAAMALLGEKAVLTTVPAVTGPHTGDDLRRHLAEDVLPHRPADLVFRRVSRTADVRKLVDERTVEFTHDRELPWLLPGVAPTHRRAEVLAISVVSFTHRTRGALTTSLIATHRTLWDHATLADQLQLDPGALRIAGPAQQVGR